MLLGEGDCLEKEIMQGTVPGIRKQGRPKMGWNNDMEKWAKMSFEKLLRKLGAHINFPLNHRCKKPFCVFIIFFYKKRVLNIFLFLERFYFLVAKFFIQLNLLKSY